jgi:hypothetical protein
MEPITINALKDKLEDKKFLEGVSFFVAFGKDNAEPIVVSSSSEKPLIKFGPTMKLEKLREMLKAESEIKSFSIFKTYGSPGCQIMSAFGDYLGTCW